MNKTSIALFTCLVSGSALATTNGTYVNWQNNYSDIAKTNCTNIVIGGNQILTAAHCLQTDSIQFSDGSTVNALSRKPHPNYETTSGGGRYDVAVWTLPTNVETNNIHFLANINTQTVKVGDMLKSFGFGGDNPLSYVTYSVTETAHNPNYVWTLIESISTVPGATLIPGDSGGMALNASGKVIGLNSASDGVKTASQTDLFYAKDFILEQVNGWHYPTLAKTASGKATITVQSLHQNPTADAAYTDGAITLVGGTCQGNNNISAFETCTYEIEGTGEGKLYLSADEFVHINKPTVKPDNGGSTGGSSGGSMSWLSLAALALLRLRKQK